MQLFLTTATVQGSTPTYNTLSASNSSVMCKYASLRKVSIQKINALVWFP